MTREGGSSLTPPIRGRGAAKGCCAPPRRGAGAGGAGCADSVRAAAAPGSIPAICLSLRPDRGGGGRPGGAWRAPPSPWRPVCRPRAPSRGASPERNVPFPGGAPGLSGPCSHPPRIPVTVGPAERRRAANGTPTPHPSHDLKRRKRCWAPSLMSADPRAPRLPATSDPSSLTPGSLS